MDIARHAINVGMKPVISSSFESGLGLLALAELAACVSGRDTAAGLDTWRWLESDVLDGPFPVSGGRVDLSGTVPSVHVDALECLSHG